MIVQTNFVRSYVILLDHMISLINDPDNISILSITGNKFHDNCIIQKVKVHPILIYTPSMHHLFTRFYKINNNFLDSVILTLFWLN